MADNDYLLRETRPHLGSILSARNTHDTPQNSPSPNDNKPAYPPQNPRHPSKHTPTTTAHTPHTTTSPVTRTYILNTDTHVSSKGKKPTCARLRTMESPAFQPDANHIPHRYTHGPRTRRDATRQPPASDHFPRKGSPTLSPLAHPRKLPRTRLTNNAHETGLTTQHSRCQRPIAEKRTIQKKNPIHPAKNAAARPQPLALKT